jgi:hypothetical protein
MASKKYNIFDETREREFEKLREEIDPAQIVMAKVDQDHSKCSLDHRGDPRRYPDLTAVNTLMLPHNGNYFALQVCHVCEWSLNQKDWDWYLFVCFGCSTTRWMPVSEVSTHYKEQIIGMTECPICSFLSLCDPGIIH